MYYTHCCSVAQSCLTLFDPMDCSTQGFSVLHSWSLLKLMSIESVMPSSHLVLCRPLLLPASGSFLMSRLFPSGGQSIGAPASAYPYISIYMYINIYQHIYPFCVCVRIYVYI